MKIPIGYGECRLKVYWAYDGDFETQEFYFKHIAGSTFEVMPVMNEYETVDHKHIQKISGYHLHFSLKLIDTNIGSGNQDYLTEFLAYFYDTVFIDGGNNDAAILGHDLWLDLFNGGPTGNDYEKGQMHVIAQPPKIEDISINRGAGQYLLLNCKSREMLSKQNMRDFWATYKTDGSWGTIEPPEEQTGGFDNVTEGRVVTSMFAEDI